MKLYLAGAMTGIPQFNFPTFSEWATRLQASGFEVVSPHEQDPPDVQAAAWASETGDAADLPAGDTPVTTAIRNVANVGECQGVALIPGWERSAGTLHEVMTAIRFRLPIAPAPLWEHVGALHAAKTLGHEEEARCYA